MAESLLDKELVYNELVGDAGIHSIYFVNRGDYDVRNECEGQLIFAPFV